MSLLRMLLVLVTNILGFITSSRFLPCVSPDRGTVTEKRTKNDSSRIFRLFYEGLLKIMSSFQLQL